MRWRARVRRITGSTKHYYLGTTEQGGALGRRKAPAAARLEIVEEPEGCFLLRYDPNGNCVADTWHPSLKDAFEQAFFEYGVEDTDWEGPFDKDDS